MDLARLQIQRNAAQNLDGSEGFRNVLGAKNGFHKRLQMSGITRFRMGKRSSKAMRSGSAGQGAGWHSFPPGLSASSSVGTMGDLGLSQGTATAPCNRLHETLPQRRVLSNRTKVGGAMDDIGHKDRPEHEGISVRAARIQDVAKLADVSTATVSRALATPERVSPEARARVL